MVIDNSTQAYNVRNIFLFFFTACIVVRLNILYFWFMYWMLFPFFSWLQKVVHFFARWQICPSMSAEEKLYQSCIFSDQRWSQNFVCFLWICFPGLWVNPILVKIAPEQKIGPGLLGELYHLVMDFSWKFCGIKPQDPRVNRFSQSPG